MWDSFICYLQYCVAVDSWRAVLNAATSFTWNSDLISHICLLCVITACIYTDLLSVFLTTKKYIPSSAALEVFYFQSIVHCILGNRKKVSFYDIVRENRGGFVKLIFKKYLFSHQISFRIFLFFYQWNDWGNTGKMPTPKWSVARTP